MSNVYTHTPLSYSVRLQVVARYLGLLLLMSVGALVVPLIAALIWQEFDIALRYVWPLLGCLVLGLASLKIRKPKSLQSNEAYVIIGLIFFLGSLATLYPMMGSGLSLMDAWFESVSGITTTGLSVAQLDEISTQTFFFARAWMQWYGGLGILVFSLAIALQQGTDSKVLLSKIASPGDVVTSTRAYTRKLLLIYSVITVLGIVGLLLFQLSLSDALALTFSSISTGGFSPYVESLAGLGAGVQSLILLISFLGAISFPLFWVVNLKSVKELFMDRQLALLLLFILFFAVMFTLLNTHEYMSVGFANALSNQTTTGYSTLDMSQISASSKFLFLVSMLTGGATLSTAGGMKLGRFLVLLQAVRLVFARTTLPKHAASFESLGTKARELSQETVACFCLFSLYVTAIFVSTLIFVAMGYPLVDSLFDVTSALGTVGVSSGVTSPELPTLLKGVLCVDMLLGRVEIIALVILLYPKTLFGRRMRT